MYDAVKVRRRLDMDSDKVSAGFCQCINVLLRLLHHHMDVETYRCRLADRSYDRRAKGGRGLRRT